MVKWVVELSEFPMNFPPRRAIEEQALSEFIVECTSPLIQEVTPIVKVMNGEEF